MVIANQLREKNRVEYLLYLWQVEDILRAFNCDFESVRDKYLPQFKLSDDLKKQTEEWYQNLCEMMHSEGVMKVGHLQISKNVLLQLEDLHKQLMASAKFPYYHQMYFKVLPYVVELRGRGVDNGESDVAIAGCSVWRDALEVEAPECFRQDKCCRKGYICVSRAVVGLLLQGQERTIGF